ncbi:MAG: hypothetical protein Q9216_003233 [Gyalolechia sp. 2 TL-2023]
MPQRLQLKDTHCARSQVEDLNSFPDNLFLPVLPIAQRELQDFRSHGLPSLTSNSVPKPPSSCCIPQPGRNNIHAARLERERWVSFDKKVRQNLPRALYERFRSLATAVQANEGEIEHLYMELRGLFLHRNEHELWREFLVLSPELCEKRRELILGEMRVSREMAGSSEARRR